MISPLSSGDETMKDAMTCSLPCPLLNENPVPTRSLSVLRRQHHAGCSTANTDILESHMAQGLLSSAVHGI
jgi:hypothetical protein